MRVEITNKILRCWFDTNRSHGCRFDSCGEAAVDKFNSYQAIGHVVCQPIKVGVAVASHFLLHTTDVALRRQGFKAQKFKFSTIVALACNGRAVGAVRIIKTKF